MARLPFPLADIEPIVAGGTAPVDPDRRLARTERPELPERFARSRPPPAMDAMQGGPDAPRFQHQPGQPAGEVERRRLDADIRRALGGGQDPDIRHRSFAVR